MRNKLVIGAVAVLCLRFASATAAEPDGALPIHEEIESADPSNPLSAVRRAFIDVDVPTSSGQIRKAAKMLRDTAESATDETRDALHKSAMELESLGQRIEKRSVESVVEMDRVFARAFHALARHHHEVGQRHWRDHQPTQAGHRLRAAADNLERATTATGQRLSDGARDVVHESRLVSGKLIRGTGYAVDEVGRAFEGLGKQVENLGDRVATRHPVPVVVPN